ncbi:hypothetical protein SEUCBS139899_002359 [Sporothrix eucalyptigena]|uniref:Uncharacterized protein n=1 Tax=Sporothrix eucalyptigena TaxID=1812306 RepID=A0ABP0B1P1_9PEZI
MSYERSASYGTPSSDTAVNTSQSVGSNYMTQAQAEGGNNNNNNIYAIQVSPSHSGQPISPQWITPTATAADHHPLPLVAPFHQGAVGTTDYVPIHADHSQTQPDPIVQLLDQHAWHGLKLYESFGAIPDNNITILDYFSTTPLGMDDQSLGGGPVGSLVQNAHIHDGPTQTAGTAGHDMVGAWPDSLTNSILNFQPNFHDLGDFAG